MGGLCMTMHTSELTSAHWKVSPSRKSNLFKPQSGGFHSALVFCMLFCRVRVLQVFRHACLLGT